jgi:hypothetical protein
MKNKAIKVFGIGTVTLFVLMALLPVCSATSVYGPEVLEKKPATAPFGFHWEWLWVKSYMPINGGQLEYWGYRWMLVPDTWVKVTIFLLTI